MKNKDNPTEHVECCFSEQDKHDIDKCELHFHFLGNTTFQLLMIDGNVMS